MMGCREDSMRRPSRSCSACLSLLALSAGWVRSADPQPTPAHFGSGAITFEDRVWARRRIEQVNYEHRAWPAGNPASKPPFAALFTDSRLERLVRHDDERVLRLLATQKQTPTPVRLQRELDRIARNSRNPGLLKELFAALNDDPRLIADTLARWSIDEPGDAGTQDDSEWTHFVLPEITATSTPGCDVWVSIPTAGAPPARTQHTAVWTGVEMIIWGGVDAGSPLDTGGRYFPATDSWLPVSLEANTPAARYGHTAIWNGSEMLIWGGVGAGSMLLNSGGRYDPSLDSWSPISTGLDSPSARNAHTAVWLAGRMIIWGGSNGVSRLNTGGRYDPAADIWAATSTAAGVPEPRSFHAAVATGSEMMIMGGFVGSQGYSYGRYDPVLDQWLPVVAPGGPRRLYLTAVWTGTEMIDWGGMVAAFTSYLTNQGYRYDGSTAAWTVISQGASVPPPRDYHTAVWTGGVMVIWGGNGSSGATPPSLNTGGRYSPPTDSWLTTSLGAFTPSARMYHSAVWSSNAMIVWGGQTDYTGTPAGLADGGLYYLDHPASPLNSLRLSKSSTLDLQWSAAALATGYTVRSCDLTTGPCAPSAVAAAPGSPSYSEPLDSMSRFFAVEAVNACGATP